MKNFELKKLRLKNHKTQKDIAKMLDLEVSTYTKKENGQIPFSIKEVLTLKEIFKLNDSEVIDIFLNKNVS